MGTGESLKKYADRVKKFITNNNITNIGVHYMNKLFVPDFLLFVSLKRYRQYGHLVHKNSCLVLAPKIKVRDKNHKRVPVKNKYPSAKGKMTITDSIRCRGAAGGTIAAGYAILCGAKEVYFVGMDGYSGGAKHFYKENDNSKKRLKEHELATPMILKDLEKYAVIKILTPTVYRNWHVDWLDV